MNTAQHVHFIGIGGYGMSAIARVMLDLGYHVSGSDVMKKDLTDKLAARGARIFIGHKESNIEGAELVVYSTDIPHDNVELLAAKKQNIPYIHRSEMLAKIMNEKKGIAVAGAHGKTTTSSMIALIMESNNLDPTFVIGGEVLNIGSNAKAGKSDYVVAEADESDGSFLQYYPYISVVTNIEADHLENYGGKFENLKQAYRKFLNQLKPEGLAIVCYDDPYIREMLPDVKGKTITFGFDNNADMVAKDLVFINRTSIFTVVYRGKKLGNVKLSIPGKHNILNALAAIVVGLEIGIPFSGIAEALKDFTGAKRRFQVIAEHKQRVIIDDYAHHPTEIQATISAAKATGKRIVAVFQPQRYTRTFFLLDAFSRAFSEADEVVITDIYSPAGDNQIEGINAKKLVELIKKNSNPNVKFFPTKEEVLEYLSEVSRPNDLILTMGAGDIWKVAYQLADKWDNEKL
ncbi:UDP-N-acetylmuramate--L-alanine ligase [Vulcanibacillus modesticaldus]|uniref:UDP-N-acetylmuramate--L-alanine ligase n=1 Tax=Vulcanibacillus modesticaldus TaxID=337097 RepID=A0A1D2YSS3_9BACI|nr:UDP-N-acetylmuramate--L-alanine ligase [Vulcanibacillus modesticaldus]OEF98061.1 UDP-N-acetylmuramate--L-alanine ligase [Vulcanibacillus modesticaldus]